MKQKKSIYNFANFLSISRIFIAGPLVVCFENLTDPFYFLCSILIIVYIILSDMLDGYFARLSNCVTDFGKIIDPIADKALLVGTYITLGHESFLPIWLVILVVFRDIVIVGGALIFHTVTQSLSMRPLMISKVNTVAQLLLAIGVLFIFGYDFEGGHFIEVTVYFIAFTTLSSGTAYVTTWSNLAAELEKQNSNHL